MALRRPNSRCEWQISRTQCQRVSSSKECPLVKERADSQGSGGLGSGSVFDYATHRELSAEPLLPVKRETILFVMQLSRLIVWKFLLMAVMLCLIAWACLFLASLRARRQAQSLLVAVRAMKVGSTTRPEVRHILARYPVSDFQVRSTSSECPSADAGLVVGFSSTTSYRFGLRFPALRYLGLADWSAAADMLFEKDRLCELRYHLSVETNGPDKIRERHYITTEESVSGRDPYVIAGGGPPIAHAEIIFLPPEATPSERASAYGYDLSCLTTVGGCRTFCHVLPLKPVWEGIIARRPDIGITIPQAVLDDPYCNP
jgi:hypothetical protein